MSPSVNWRTAHGRQYVRLFAVDEPNLGEGAAIFPTRVGQRERDAVDARSEEVRDVLWGQRRDADAAGVEVATPGHRAAVWPRDDEAYGIVDGKLAIRRRIAGHEDAAALIVELDI